MRVRSREIRKSRKREEEQLKARIKELKAARNAVIPARSRVRRTTA